MNRKGIVDYCSVEKNSDILGEDTFFRSIISKMVENLVSKGKWFSFCTKINDEQEDIMSILNSNGVKMGRMVLDAIGECEQYRTDLFKYFIHDYACYCEIPTVIRQRDATGFKDSYNKTLVTANLNVIANWLDISYEEARMKFGARVEENEIIGDDSTYPYVKLCVAKDGTRKVSKPRKDLDLGQKGIRIIPLFALKVGIDTLVNMTEKGFYDVTFIKDSGQERVINICSNYNMLCEVYKNKGLLTDAFEEQYKGDYLDSPTMPRGYVRFIEVGTNLESHAVRSINLARIVSIKKAEPDLTFVDVNLDNVVSTFLNKVSVQNIDYKEFVDALDMFNVGTTRKYNEREINSYSDLENWVNMQEMLLSTPFIKQLALFMMGNPQWFGVYTGKEETVIAEDISSIDEDFDMDLDFDF